MEKPVLSMDRWDEHEKMDKAIHMAYWQYDMGLIESSDLYDAISTDLDWLDSLPAVERKEARKRRWAYDLCDRLYQWLQKILNCGGLS